MFYVLHLLCIRKTENAVKDEGLRSSQVSTGLGETQRLSILLKLTAQLPS